MMCRLRLFQRLGLGLADDKLSLLRAVVKRNLDLTVDKDIISQVQLKINHNLRKTILSYEKLQFLFGKSMQLTKAKPTKNDLVLSKAKLILKLPRFFFQIYNG